MRKPLIIALSIVGVVIFGIILVNLFSLFIYAQKNSGTQEVGGVRPEISVGAPSYDSGSKSPVYNNAEGSKVKKNGVVSFLVNNLDSANNQLEVLNNKYDGEVTNIFDSGKGNDRTLQVTVKVPVEKFDSYYKEIREMDGTVSYANVNSADVTEEYIDITSRLANLKSVEAQLTEILDKAESVQDILAVQSELSKTRGEIERYEQQKRYFDSQADYAHLSITFSIDKEGLSIADEEWKPLGEFRVALNSLVSVLKSFVNLLIWSLVFSPVVLVPAGIVWFATKKRTK